MMKKILYILLLATFLISCGEEDFLDINENPNSSVNADANLLFTGAIVEHSNGRTQYMQQYLNYWTQHFVSGNASGLLTSWEEYDRNATLLSIWSNNFWGEYSSIQSLVLAEQTALEQGFLNTAAQAKILKSQFYLDMTLIWERIPYSQANNTNFNNPEFDDQDFIFDGIIAELDSAVSIADPAEGGAVQGGDLIYAGDMNAWVKYARSLKFYVLMLKANAGEDVSAELQATYDAGLFTTNEDDAFLSFQDVPGQQNPGWGLFDQFNAWNFDNDGAEGQGFAFYLSDNFLTVLSNYNNTLDPRVSLFFALPDGETEYNSINIGDDALGSTAFVDENIYNPTYPDFYLTNSEIQLLVAEAALKNYITANDAEAFENGVNASFERYNSLSTGRSVDPATFNGYFVAELQGQTNSPSNTTVATTALEHVYLQQYIDGFLMGINSWTTWRKNSILKDLEVLPVSVLSAPIRRFPYDVEEPQINPNFPETVEPLDEPMYFEN